MITRVALLAAALLSLSFANTAAAAEDKFETAAASDNSGLAAIAEDSSEDFAAADQVSLEELDQNRGAFVNVWNKSSMKAFLENTSVNNANTGANTIANDSINGFSGIGSFIQNSGNNVIVQQNTIVNANFF